MPTRIWHNRRDLPHRISPERLRRRQRRSPSRLVPEGGQRDPPVALRWIKIVRCISLEAPRRFCPSVPLVEYPRICLVTSCRRLGESYI
jgi:hypothetical protein